MRCQAAGRKATKVEYPPVSLAIPLSLVRLADFGWITLFDASGMTKIGKKRFADGVGIAFMLCVGAGLVVEFLKDWGVIEIEKKLSELGLAVGWLVATALWTAGAIIRGEVNWMGGGLFVSREKTPIRFWFFICCMYILFTVVGLAMLLGRH